MIEGVLLREPDEDEKGYIISSWCKSNRLAPAHKNTRSSVYFPEHKAIILNLLDKSEVVCAAHKTDRSQMYAWACFSKKINTPILHYLFVKETFRNLGFGKSLLDLVGKGPIVTTHRTLEFDAFAMKVDLDFIYNPYIAYMETK